VVAAASETSASFLSIGSEPLRNARSSKPGQQHGDGDYGKQRAHQLVRFELSPFFQGFEDDFDRFVDADLV